jgi:hypothetical protein
MLKLVRCCFYDTTTILLFYDTITIFKNHVIQIGPRAVFDGSS